MKIYIEEAKAGAKICPHLPVDTTTEEADALHVARVKAFATCWGGKCAAWRWARTHINNPEGGDMIPSDDTHGFCGLSGIPSP